MLASISRTVAILTIPLFAALCIFPFAAKAQTVITGNVTWTGTILITSNTTVDPWAVLTISPGTTVLFGPDVHLSVEGRIIAVGTELAPIVFSGENGTIWNGITLQYSSYDSEFRYCKFSLSSQQMGGALDIDGTGTILSHCEFRANKASRGGALYFRSMRRTELVEYCLITDNTADIGGGIYLDEAGIDQFRFNTVVDNSATATGGIVCVGGFRFYNNIVWGNENGDLQMPKAEAGHLYRPLEYSIVGGNVDFPAVGLINQDPQFTDAAAGDYSLKSSSPAIDHGCHCVLDSDGTRSDMGYLPTTQALPHLDYIMVDSLSTRNVVLSKQPVPYIVCSGIKLRAGETLTIGAGAQLIFAERGTINVYGNLQINGSLSDSVLITALDTASFLDWSGRQNYGWGGISVYPGGSATSSYAIFENMGFTNEPSFNYTVGGFKSNGGSMTFDRCRFELRRRRWTSHLIQQFSGTGGLMSISNSRFNDIRGKGVIFDLQNTLLTLQGNEFTNNYLTGIMVSRGSDATIRNNLFANNHATRSFFYINSFKVTTTIEQNEFRDNWALIEISSAFDTPVYFRNNIYDGNRGQIHIEWGSPIFAGNVIRNNTFQYSDFEGNFNTAVLSFDNSSPNLINNTIVSNKLPGGAAVMMGTQKAIIMNNIMVQNDPLDIYNYNSPNNFPEGVVFRNNFTSDTTANNYQNIWGDPRLSKNEPDFALAPNSPAINRGSYEEVFSYLLQNDLLGNPRVQNAIDMGAIEFTGTYVPLTDLSLSDTRIGGDELNSFVAMIATRGAFPQSQITFSLADDLGTNNNYFTIVGNSLRLITPITNETILRIKLRVDHTSGAWIEKYFYLTTEPIITAVNIQTVENPQIYPNPVSSTLNVRSAQEGSHYGLFTLDGKVMKEGIMSGDGQLDIQELRDGVYMLRFLNGNRIDILKVIKISK